MPTNHNGSKSYTEDVIMLDGFRAFLKHYQKSPDVIYLGGTRIKKLKEFAIVRQAENNEEYREWRGMRIVEVVDPTYIGFGMSTPNDNNC